MSRGGIKCEHALRTFCLSVDGQTCLDIGASTGGFTDCLLQHGAARVHAVDVGYGQLAYALRKDERVVVMERTNARYLSVRDFPYRFDLAVIDVSFISLKKIFPVLPPLLVSGGAVLALIKPNFEVGKGQVGKRGVVREPALHIRVLDDLLKYSAEGGFTPLGLTYSPLKGPEGNIEYFLLCGARHCHAAALNPVKVVDDAICALGMPGVKPRKKLALGVRT